MKKIVLTGLMLVSCGAHAMADIKSRIDTTKMSDEQRKDFRKQVGEIEEEFEKFNELEESIAGRRDWPDWASTNNSGQGSVPSNASRITKTTHEFNNRASEESIKRRKLTNNTYKAFVATGISGFTTIWGIKSLFNKEKDSMLSWCAIAGGGVGLWYAFTDLKKNLSKCFFSKY